MSAAERIADEVLAMNDGYWAKQFPDLCERAWFRFGIIQLLADGDWNGRG